MAVTNEQQEHITQRGKEKGRAEGGRGSGSFRQGRRQAQRRPCAAATPGTARAQQRLLGGTSQPQGGRSPPGTPSSPRTEIPVQPCGLPIGRGHRGEEPRQAGTDPCGAGPHTPKPFSKCLCSWCPRCPCSGSESIPWADTSCLPLPCTGARAALPRQCHSSLRLPSFLLSFPFRIVVTAPRIPLIYPQPYKPGFHLQSLGNQDISTAVSFWQRPVLPLFFPQHIFHS